MAVLGGVELASALIPRLLGGVTGDTGTPRGARAHPERDAGAGGCGAALFGEQQRLPWSPRSPRVQLRCQATRGGFPNQTSQPTRTKYVSGYFQKAGRTDK